MHIIEKILAGWFLLAFFAVCILMFLSGLCKQPNNRINEELQQIEAEDIGDGKDGE